jgi:Trypsin
MLPHFSYADNPRPDDPVRVIGTGTDTAGTYFPTVELEAAQACVYSKEECTGQYANGDIKVEKNTMVCAGQDSGKVDALVGTRVVHC